MRLDTLIRYFALALLLPPLWANAAAGDVDTSFNPGTGANSYLYTSAVQTDGKIIIGGAFTTLNGVASNYIARLHADGSVDSSFNSGTAVNDGVSTSAVQVDGKIIIGGWFTTVNGVARSGIARLHADGSVDGSFNPGTGVGGPSPYVYTSAVQADGKIIIGGDFTTVNGVARSKIARLHADGSLDSSFNLGTGANGYVYTSAVQADGKVIIGGYFSTVNGVARNHIARLHADGSLDFSFNPGTGANSDVYTITVQADGKIIFGGGFSTVNDVALNCIARLHADGSLDSSFNPGTGTSGPVLASAVQADGKIIIGGIFATVNGVARNHIARLHADGSLDSSFNPGTGASSLVSTSAVHADGKIFIGGDFTTVNGVARNRIARIHSGDSDSDGIEDAADKFPGDTDNDGIGNNADTDDDGDGIPDYIDANSLSAAIATEKTLLLNDSYKGSIITEHQSAQ